MSNGYIVVSASGDTDLIQEFSYTDKPLFSNENLYGSEKVYYTGVESYFGKKNNKVYDLDNTPTQLTNIKNKTKHDPQILKHNLQMIRKVKQPGRIDINAYMGAAGQSSDGQGSYGGIYDTTQYVTSQYGSNFTAIPNGWGTLEPAITPFKYLLNDFQYNVNNCTVVGLTTIMEYYQDATHQLNTSYTAQDMYNQIIRPIAVQNGYTDAQGTPWTSIPTIATNVLHSLGDPNGSASPINILWWHNVTDEINAGRPFLWNIDTGYYNNHTIVAVGYNSYSDVYLTEYFVKVYDGWTTDNRYVDWNDYDTTGTVGNFTIVHP